MKIENPFSKLRRIPKDTETEENDFFDVRKVLGFEVGTFAL
jgi:hypothetical protein